MRPSPSIYTLIDGERLHFHVSMPRALLRASHNGSVCLCVPPSIFVHVKDAGGPARGFGELFKHQLLLFVDDKTVVGAGRCL